VAARWLLTARTVDGAEAERSGFADELVATGASVDGACAFVEAIGKIPSVATRRQLALLRGVAGRSADEARMAEMRAFAACWITSAHRDAVARFFARERA
jgi:enoyl-CoA hydratase/carnithine racemase